MRLPVILLSFAVLAGCSSFRADADKVQQVPGDRLLAFQDVQPGGGQITVNRDIGFLGGGCYLAVLVDRQLAARIGIGEEASFQVPAGARIVGISVDTQDDTLCGKGVLNRELAVQVAAGENYHFRIVSQNVGGFAILADQR